MKILKWGIYLIIFCLPLYLIRLKVLGIPTTVLELMIYGLFALWLVNKGYKDIWTALKHEGLLVWGIVFLMVGVSMATIFSWDLRVSAGIWKSWFIDALIFFFVVVSIIKKDDIKNIFRALIYSGLAVSIISLVYLIQGNFNYQGRLQGIYNSPNFLAMYLAPILIILVANIYSRINIRLILFLVFLILAVTLFFTKSFGVLLGILAALVFGLAIHLYQKKKIKLALGIIFLAFAIIFIFGLVKIESLEGLKSFDARFVIWQTAWESFEDNPITGIGPGTFEDYFPPYPKWGVPQPHNVFLAFLLQTGIVGFVGFILILIWFFRPRADQPRAGRWQLLLMMIMIYILAHGLVDTTYWKNDLSLVFWVIIGVMVIIKKES
ncbi:O-antigen ligase family protein [Patescibacteria group bacterium]|nr:O-antigen ligase family protein [Patescibacteria group bacterium]MBU4458896.1 O-antigen ligase family protein [Patescibacteria group bacterium]MCG2696178.1 O-antigen ligase family protein [Candidatus Portnoybacteria bacterium]